jgi:hypothetical protein
LRVIDDLRRDVARITRRAEIGNVLGQHRGGGSAGLRHGYAVFLGLVRRHDAGTARRSNDGNAARFGHGSLGKKSGGFHERLKIIDEDRAGTAECGQVGGIRTGQGTSV